MAWTKWTLVSEWSISTMSMKPTQGKARKPPQPWTEEEGGHLLFHRAFRSTKAQAPEGWEPPRPSRQPHPAALSALSLTTVWPPRAGFGSRTPGTLRQKEYPEPRRARSHSLHYKYPPGCWPDSNHNSRSLVGRRTAGLFPQEIQHNQPGMAKMMKYGYKLTPCPAKPCFSPSSCPYLASDPQRSKRGLKVENPMNETSVWSLGKTVEHSLKIMMEGRRGRKEGGNEEINSLSTPFNHNY